jgi:DNA replication protein DnaD
MLKLAYDECINQKAKLSMPYIAKILENWHEKGYEKPEDIENSKTANKKGDGRYGFASYDLDLFAKMLNKDD